MQVTPLKRDIISVFPSMTMADDDISPDTIVEDFGDEFEKEHAKTV